MKQVLLGGLAFTIFLSFSSCGTDNESVSPANRQDINQQRMLKKLPGIIKELPKFKIVQESAKSAGKGEKNDGFDFSNDNDGFDFANPSGNTYSDDEGYIIVTSPGFGSNAGGVVSAGNNTYDISQTFCLSASEENDDDDEKGEDIIDFLEAGIEGVSFVLGVSGDLDGNIAQDDEDESFGLNAVVLYVVFDDRAQGNYDVINFFDAFDGSEEPDFGGQAYAYIFDYENGIIYISSEGSLSVNGGNITFSGEYLEINVGGDGFFEINEDEDFKFVNGAGTLGC